MQIADLMLYDILFTSQPVGVAETLDGGGIK